jgi:hypothetical protein
MHCVSLVAGEEARQSFVEKQARIAQSRAYHWGCNTKQLFNHTSRTHKDVVERVE